MRDEVKIAVYDVMTDPEFKHEKGYLNHYGYRCVWGVICDLAIADGVLVDRRHVVGNGFDYYNGQTTVPPDSVIRWAGCEADEQQEVRELLTFNDEPNHTARDVAEYVKNLP